MMLPNKLVIFDGNHLAYRAYFKFSNLKTLDGVKTAIIYGVPYILESLIRKFSPTEVILVFDGGRSKFRSELRPDYKKREKRLGFDPQDFHEQKEKVINILISLGIKVARAKGVEADDLIAMISRRYSKKDWDTLIISSDKDFNQLIDKKITVYNVSKNKLLDQNNLKDIVGYNPEQCVDYLCLVGDKSDNIGGYSGIGPKKAEKFLNEFEGIVPFLNSDIEFGRIDKEKLKDIYYVNRKLIDLKYFYIMFMIKKKIPWLNIFPVLLDLKVFKLFCNTYEMNSFLKPQFINTFKKLNSLW